MRKLMKKWKKQIFGVALFALAAAAFSLVPLVSAHAGDPTGASLGGVADIAAKTAGQPTL